jgi:hypothetical protein
MSDLPQPLSELRKEAAAALAGRRRRRYRAGPPVPVLMGEHMKPLAFTDTQLAQVITASGLLPLNDRDNFLRSIAGVLAASTSPTDIEVADAITFVLECSGVATNGFMHAAAANNNRRKLNAIAPATPPRRRNVAPAC